MDKGQCLIHDQCPDDPPEMVSDSDETDDDDYAHYMNPTNDPRGKALVARTGGALSSLSALGVGSIDSQHSDRPNGFEDRPKVGTRVQDTDPVRRAGGNDWKGWVTDQHCRDPSPSTFPRPDSDSITNQPILDSQTLADVSNPKQNPKRPRESIGQEGAGDEGCGRGERIMTKGPGSGYRAIQSLTRIAPYPNITPPDDTTLSHRLADI